MIRRLVALVAIAVLGLAAVIGVNGVTAADNPQTDPVIDNGDDAAQRAASTRASNTLVFTALDTPCRLWDDRIGAGTLGQDTARVYRAADPVASQGGRALGCHIPPSAAAVEVSLSTIGGSPDSDGFLRAGPGNDTTPDATVLQFLPRQGTSVTTTVRLDTQARLTLQAKGGSTRTVGDAIGFYEFDSHALVFANGNVIAASNLVDRGANVRTGTGTYQLTFATAANADCTATVSNFGTGTTASVTLTDTSNGVGRIGIASFFDGTVTPADAAFSVAWRC